jgi:hypothetical protein
MTPNGIVLLTVAVLLSAALATSPVVLLVLLGFVLVFGLAGLRAGLLGAIAWSTAIVAPLALFMVLVWVVVVGRAPAEIASGTEGSRVAASLHVATVCLRLFIMATMVQVAVLRFAGWTPLRFIRALRIPLTAKKLVILTLSLVETILQAVDRARTALIAAGVITRRHSLTNLRNGWILVQTVWLATITIVLGRLRDKWKAEDTVAQLDGTLQRTAAEGLTRADVAWLALLIGLGAIRYAG